MEHTDAESTKLHYIAVHTAASGCVETFKSFLEQAESIGQPVDIHKNKEYLFRRICESNNVAMLEFILGYAKSIDIHILDELGYATMCYYSNVEMLKYLLEYAESINSPIDIHARGVSIYVICYETNEPCVVKYLLDYSKSINSPIDVHVDDEQLFRSICGKGDAETLKFLIDYSKSINSPIDVNVMRDEGFRNMCHINGDVDVIIYLINYAISINSPIDIQASNHFAFKISVSRKYKELSMYLADESLVYESKYLYDPENNVGYIFRCDSNVDVMHDYYGEKFCVTRDAPDYKFLDENVHKLNSKKSANTMN